MYNNLTLRFSGKIKIFWAQKVMVIGRKPKKIYIYELKVNPLHKWTASNTWGVLSVAT